MSDWIRSALPFCSSPPPERTPASPAVVFSVCLTESLESWKRTFKSKIFPAVTVHFYTAHRSTTRPDYCLCSTTHAREIHFWIHVASATAAGELCPFSLLVTYSDLASSQPRLHEVRLFVGPETSSSFGQVQQDFSIKAAWDFFF